MGDHRFRDATIRPLVRNMTVLDVGSVNHGETTDLYDLCLNECDRILGIDILPSNVPGIVQADAQEFLMSETFDVVVAGEVIEHLERPFSFLNCCWSNLKDDGLLIITTPNCLSPLWYFKGGSPNEEHTHWYDEKTLAEMARRAGFKCVHFTFYSRYNPSFANALWRLACKISPRLNVHLLMVFVKVKQ